MKRRRQSDVAKKSVGETQIARGTANFLLGGFVACLLLAASSLLLDTEGKATVEGEGKAQSNPEPGRGSLSLESAWRARLAQPKGPAEAPFLLARSLFNWAGETVVRGTGGWLFSRQAFLQFTAPAPANPASAEAVRQVGRYLARRNVVLVVLPTPDKLNFEFRNLGLDISMEHKFLLTPTERAWLDDLQPGEDWTIIPPAASFAHPARPFFLRTDSGWRPETLGSIAQAVASHLIAEGDFPRLSLFRDESPEVISRRGNLALSSSSPAEAETADVWRLEPMELLTDTHEVVLVGDYLAAIFEEEEAGWGGRAGLPSRLAAEITRPLKTFLTTSGSSAPAMDRFLRDLQQNPSAYRDLRTVIWQISTTELGHPQWDHLIHQLPAIAR